MKRIALTLPGGGARAAYQAGVLRAISDICKFKESPFQIISGVSAGAINGMWLAAEAKDFSRATAMMCANWKEISVSDVYKTDPFTLFVTGTTWLRNLSLGEWFGRSHVTYLFDTSPLAKLLNERIDYSAIQENLDSGLLYGLSLSVTDYHLGTAVTFFAGNKKIKSWTNSLSIGRRDRITRDHILASAAIPIFFPPVRIKGRDYGDGGIGLKTPLSPAIHLGAERILVVGVQNPKKIDPEKDVLRTKRATLGDIAGSLLNSLFLNSLDADIDRLQKVNHTVSRLTPKELKAEVNGIRDIPLLVIRPSRDLSCLDSKEFSHLPFTIRHLLRGLGLSSRKGWNLLSYLAFDRRYSETLLELGYKDGMAMKKDILKFFED